MPNIQKIESEMQRVLSISLQREAHDPKLAGVNITVVQVTRDLSFATIYYTLSMKSDKIAIQKSLVKSSGFLKKQIANEMEIRKIPELIFKYDESIEYGNKIDAILNSLK